MRVYLSIILRKNNKRNKIEIIKMHKLYMLWFDYVTNDITVQCNILLQMTMMFRIWIMQIYIKLNGLGSRKCLCKPSPYVFGYIYVISYVDSADLYCIYFVVLNLNWLKMTICWKFQKRAFYYFSLLV